MVKHTKNFLKLNIDWQIYIDNFNYSANQESSTIKFNQLAFYVSDDAIKIKELKPLFEKIKPTFAHLYLSLSNLDETFGAHTDTMDVWFWQGIGKTLWTTYENETENENTTPGG